MLLIYLSAIPDSESHDIFIEIYEKHRASMYKIARFYTRDHYKAEDALQNAFLGIAKNMDKIKSLTSEQIETYVHKIAKNAAISLLRKEKNVCVDIDDMYLDVASDDNIEESAADKETIDEMIQFIKSMKQEYRDVLSYSFLYDMSPAQIADILNVPLSTVKTRYYRGLALLKERFGENG